MKTFRVKEIVFAMCLLAFPAPRFLANAHAAPDQSSAPQPKKKNKAKNNRKRKKLILKSRHSKHSRRPA